jgi:hypothetical protein
MASPIDARQRLAPGRSYGRGKHQYIKAGAYSLRDQVALCHAKCVRATTVIRKLRDELKGNRCPAFDNEVTTAP